MTRGGQRGVRTARAKVGLSTASVYPESTAVAFELAAKLGYDGVEVMVWTDPISQDPYALQKLSQQYGVAILAIHAPCLVITQRVWTTDPWTKLQKAQFAAELLGAQTVVVHPPFRWQREYARNFRAGVQRLSQETDVRFAVENMFPLRVRGREVSAYQPSWDVAAEEPYRDYTLDLSHSAVSHSDSLFMLDAMGNRLSHLHIADGTGLPKDEHLVPGRGDQPCAEILERLAQRYFTGHVIVEINTRRALDRTERERDLAEALAFCRLHLVASRVPDTGRARTDV
ncbi:sugar phosphate isomerase/epimerase family protein [uncultured Jatrophihabitans sp.]|uniref:sugar phosphate isomerase/epimerase family protein n=1 Tax=uncultured Jatrophihabitans sp. TaxID=1610747 RepID=UPI0035C960B1